MKTIAITDINNFSLLYETLKSSYNKATEYCIDISKLDFFSPHQILMLVLFIIYHKKNGGVGSIKPPTNKKASKYLSDINLLEFCKSNYDQPRKLSTIHSQTAMPIRRITTSTMNEYITFTQSYFNSLCPEKDLALLNLSIAELINNVYDHAKSPIDAYVFCQYYPRLKQIKVAVADLGIGIPQSVNDFLVMNNDRSLSDLEALKWAITSNKSAKTKPHNVGKGLNNLIIFTKRNVCELQIYTNKAYLHIAGNDEIIKNNPIPHFFGTIVEVIINIANLPDLDMETLIDLW